MDGGDQKQKELTISLAASSMINGSDSISEEAYQANWRRIQEVKEMVRRLEVNNENAHKNFIVDQLEKRAKDGREAETMLVQLRGQPDSAETVQFANDVPSGNPEVILPTTATLVEVPDSHSSNIQQTLPAEYQRNLTSQVHPVQPYQSIAFRYYTPPSAVRQPQSSAVPHAQVPTDGQMNWNTTQSLPLQSRVYNQPVHQPGLQPPPVQRTSPSWSSYPPPVIAVPPADTIPAPGYYAPPSGWAPTASVRAGSSIASSGMTCHEPDFRSQSVGSRPPVTAPNQSQNLPSPTSASWVQAPLHSVPVPSANISYGNPPARSLTNPVEPRSQSSRTLSAAVSKPVTISELQGLRQPPQQPQFRHYRHQQQPQQSSQPAQQSGHHSRPTQLHPQGHFHPLPQPQQENLPDLQSERAPARLHPPLQPVDHILSTGVSQPHGRPSQARDSLSVNTSTTNSQREPPQLQEQAQPRSPHTRVDQATFFKLFQLSVERGIPHVHAFFLHAKASGITDDWLKAAVNSLPRRLAESLRAQVNQLAPTADVSSSTNVSQQQMSTISGLNGAVTTVQPLPTGTPFVQTTRASHNPPAEESSPSGGRPGSYATQLRYYAEQATRSALSANVSTTPENINLTPTRDVPQGQATRTPKDANKSTLARDILRSLGKVAPSQEMGTATDESNNQDGDIREVNAAQAVAIVAPGNPSVAPTGTGSGSISIPSAEPNILAESQSITKSVWKEEPGLVAIVEGPIMIDLTLDESDESVSGHRNGQEPEPTFPIQVSTGAATSSPPTNTPLLENLSGEELPVGIAAGSDNADVRMYSPPLLQAAEENMESELVYPPIGSAERTSPSFDPLPREASEHLADGQLPLFLPSPPSSPAPTEPPETDLEMTNDEGQGGPSHKRRSVDVDKVEIDATLLIPPRVRKRPRQQIYVLIPPAPLYVKQAIERMKERALGNDVKIKGDGADEEIQYSHLELLLIEESKSRLSERRCRWLNCGAILNCATNLHAHLKNHAHEEDSQAPFLCRWASCQRRFAMEQERDRHLERHTIRPLPCPVAGCEEQFYKPVEVMEHEVQHQKAEHREHLVRKSTYQPAVPAIPARLGPPPPRLPSHRVIPRRVVKCRISAERHAIMGPWVLWNIFSPVELNTRKQNASMRGRPGRQAVNYDVDISNPRRDDYDFLLAFSSYPAKHAPPDDLDSTLITMSAARGLTLWGPGSAVDSSATAEERAALGGRGASEDVNESRRGSVGVGEEDAVERMLIL